MCDRATILRAFELLAGAVPAGSRVILFGSHARGDYRSDSDLDFLVVEPEAKDRRAEMARLSRVLQTLLVPTDILVVSQSTYDYWRDTPNTVFFRAAREGKEYGQVA